MKPIFKASHLKKYYPIKKGLFKNHVEYVKAVDDVSFSVDEQEIVGIVGESGCGKSTTARLAMRLIEPTAGEIEFLGDNFLELEGKRLKKARLNMQMVFQDPLASLNPRKTILDNLGEALLYHKRVKNKQEQAEVIVDILSKIGLPSTALGQYPHQFSGGQQQRLSIGRAIALNPRLLILDEAVSALDLSVQAQILNLLYNLKNTLKLSYLFISHDLNVVRSLCDRVIVMYKGQIVEQSPTESLFNSPKHPYTQQLLDSLPKLHPALEKYHQ
jgi:ABC-type oligopeptide transport system ATPase subunit